MPPDACGEMQLLMQADLDGELGGGEAARVAAHLDECADCARVQAQFMALSRRLQKHAPRHAAPDLLRHAIRAKLAQSRHVRPARFRGWVAGGISAGFVVAASLAIFAILPRSDTMPDWIAAAHIRALQPSHLVDVPSTDQHTVKPWFAGRLPFSPPLKDLSADGFMLAGGRIDSVPGSTAAVLVYMRRQHVIDLFIWPTADESRGRSGVREGYNFVHWQTNGMSFWAVSDLNAKELSDFVARWR